jgi:phage replication-related protein YjqB (UPF0714/DUF867 family)
MTDRYANFAELEQNEIKDVDYAILYRRTPSNFAVMAPHGGGIEPGTIDIADAIAGDEHTFYGFKGIKKQGNRLLHISSNRYDEPTGLHISQNAWVVISIHGCRDAREIVFIGGKNRTLMQNMMRALKASGFTADICKEEGLAGISAENICNRCRSRQGVQLEISRGLREKMFDRLDRRSLRKKTPAFYRFVETVRKTIGAA